MSIMFGNDNVSNLVSLIAPIDPMSGYLFKWDNRFSWSYKGDATDSILERVKRAGGDITGDLCCRLAWYNYDDLDFHMKEPNGYEIYYANKDVRSPSKGKLDVDMNAFHATTREPVENIFYQTLSTMREGIYHLFVHQFQKRETTNTGFDCEIDILGTTHSFSYEESLAQNKAVSVAKMEYTERNGVRIIESLPPSTQTKTIWGLETNKFHKVNILTISPNFWGDDAVGNKHYMFIIDDCKNDERARGFYNEFIRNSLTPHRKVIELLGNVTKIEPSNDQLSGLGFSSTKNKELVLRVNGNITRTFTVTIT